MLKRSTKYQVLTALLVGTLNVACSGSVPTPRVITSAANVQSALAGAKPSTVAQLTATNTNDYELRFASAKTMVESTLGADTPWGHPVRFTVTVAEPVWITGMTPRVRGAQTAGNHSVVYQAQLWNHSDHQNHCDSTVEGSLVAATSGALSATNFPAGYGYVALPTDKLEIVVYFQNYSEKTLENVQFEVALSVQPMAAEHRLQNVTPLLVDGDKCQQKNFAVAPGDYTEKNASLNVPINGSLVAATSLAQNHAVRVLLETQQEPVWDTTTALDSTHNLLRQPQWTAEEPVELQKNQEVQVTVSYQNDSNAWQHHASAAAIIYVSDPQHQLRSRQAQMHRSRSAASVQTTLLR